MQSIGTAHLKWYYNGYSWKQLAKVGQKFQKHAYLVLNIIRVFDNIDIKYYECNHIQAKIRNLQKILSYMLVKHINKYRKEIPLKLTMVNALRQLAKATLLEELRVMQLIMDLSTKRKKASMTIYFYNTPYNLRLKFLIISSM